MTLFYDEEREALIENHGEEYTDFEEQDVIDEDKLVFDLSEQPKRKSLFYAAKAAMEADPDFEVEAGLEWVGDE